MRSWTLLTAFVALVPALAPARAQAPNAAEPTLVVRLKSFDGLIADAKYLATLAGQGDKAQEAEAAITALAGPKGLAGTGIDTKRPLAVYATVGPNGIDSKAVIMLPVADETAFMDLLTMTLGRFGVTVAKGTDGVSTVAIPGAPVSAFIRVSGPYAYIAAGLDRTAISPENLLPANSKWLAAGDSELLGVTMNIDRIPDSLRQIALGQLDVQAGIAKSQKEPNETPAQAKLKAQTIDVVFQRVRTVLTEGAKVELKLSLDRGAGELAFQAAFSGKSGSELARGIAESANRQSIFGGVTADAAQLALNIALPPNLRGAFAAVVDEGFAQALKNETDPAKRDLAQKLFGALAPTIKAGVLDVSAGLNGPNAAGHYTIFAGVHVQDGSAIEAVLKTLADQMPAKERQAVKFDSARIGGVSVHRIDPGAQIDAEGKRLFGDQAAGLVAFRRDAALVVIGDPTAAATMKALIDAKPVPARAAVDVHASISRLAGLDKAKGAEGKKIAEAVFGQNPQGKDVVRLNVSGGPALTFRLSVKTDIITFGTRMHGH